MRNRLINRGLIFFFISFFLNNDCLAILDSQFASVPNADFIEAKKMMEDGHYDKAKKMWDGLKLEAESKKNEAWKREDWENYVSIITNWSVCSIEIGRTWDGIDSLERLLPKVVDVFDETHLLTASIYYHLGVGYDIKSKLEKALNYYKKSLNILNDQGEKDILLIAKNHIGIARTTPEYEDRIKKLKKAISLIKDNYGSEHPILANFYYNYGRTERLAYNYTDGETWAKKAFTHAEELYKTEHLKTVHYLYELAQYYRRTFQPMKAEDYFLQVMIIVKKILPANAPYFGKIYHNLGNIYHSKNQLKQANEYYLKTADNKEKNEVSLHSIKNSLGFVNLDWGNYETAIQYFLESHELTKKSYGETYIYTLLPLNNAAFACRKQGDYQQALRYYNRALDFSEKYHKEKHPIIREAYLGLGYTYMHLGNYKNSLEWFQKAISSKYNKFEFNSIYQNPTFSIGMENDFRLFKILSGKASAFYKLFREEGDIKNLKAAFSTFQLLDTIIDTKRRGFAREKDKFLFLKDYKVIYSDGIEISLALYKNFSDESQYLNRAFELMGKSKSILLLESMKDVEGKLFSKIPTSFLRTEKQLKTDIGKIEKQLQIENKWTNREKDSLQIGLFEVQEAYDELVLALEKDFPEYYKLKKDITVASIQSVQHFLPNKKTAVINYSLGANTMTVFALTQQQQIFKQKKITETTKNEINQLIELNKTYPLSFQESKEKLDTIIKDYASLSYKLYNFLLRDVLIDLKGIENLIIIRDGMLEYLPFETLLHSAYQVSNGDFADMPYLLKKYAIQYEHSATLLIENTSNKSLGENIFAGFAPAYKKRNLEILVSEIEGVNTNSSYRNEVISLKHNQTEVMQIAGLLDGHDFTGERATEYDFKKYSKDYKILHLAMHGIINDKNPNLSSLVFEPEDSEIEDNLLHAYEVYNMDLSADLTVLSACETAGGILKAGEGIMSLSRAFKKAGCPAIITSLWKAEDKSTAEIMVDFYKNLKSGQSKNNALQATKLNFLNNYKNTERSHPFFWANFILIGNNEPINFQINNFRLKYGWFFGGLLLVFGWLGYRRLNTSI